MQGGGSAKSIKIGSFVIIVIVCYLFLFFRWVYGNNIVTDIIRSDTLEDSVNTDGYIVRDEELLKSPIDGECIAIAEEGDKIPANFKIATVLSGSSIKLLDNLKDFDLRIIKEQKEKSTNEDFFSEDVVKIDDEIQQKIKLLSLEVDDNSQSGTKQLRDDINNLIEKKASIVGSKSTADVALNDLKKQRQALQDQINSNTKEIISTTSGIISYNVDGFEGQLNPASIKALTPKILEGIKPVEKNIDSSNKNVLAGKPFAKIIKGFDYYILIPASTAIAGQMKINSVVNIRINDLDKLITGSLTGISDEVEGKKVLCVRLDRNMSETTGLRKINVDLIKTSFSGLKVPVKSLVDFDQNTMKAKIIIDKSNYASIKEVKVTGKNEESAIIENLDNTENSVALYDTYVVNPENIKEGQLISQ